MKLNYKGVTMNISIFDVIGPVMIGPSSSHTAGAAKLSLAASLIVGKPIKHISFGLHGSFSKTYKGHGTDIALVGGSIGLYPDDERLPDSFKIAENMGITFEFYNTVLETGYENSVKMTFTTVDDERNEIIGCSTGGGRILITSINKLATKMTFESPSVLIELNDCAGMLNSVSAIFAKHNLNIAQIQFMREGRGESACCLIETDEKFPEHFDRLIADLPGVISAKTLPAF